VTESSVSETETTSTPDTGEGEGVGFLVLRYLRERMPNLARLVIG
jgi:hypothetical protein